MLPPWGLSPLDTTPWNNPVILPPETPWADPYFALCSSIGVTALPDASVARVNRAVPYQAKRPSIATRNRKASHNAVERRRRDFINEQLELLARIIPPAFGSTVIPCDVKLNKSDLLKHAVAYIQYLQKQVAQGHQSVHEEERDED